MRLNSIFLTLVFLFLGTALFAQVTTSAMQGEVLDENFEAVAGASVEIKHEPTGTVYNTTTDADGIFDVSGMRVGGPYTIKIQGLDYPEYTESDIFLDLGDTYEFYASLSSAESVTLEGVSLVASSRTNNDGSQTTIDSKQLQTLPNVNGGIADFVRISPTARVEEDNVINIAGQNNRYNAIYVDGAVDNDVFGLAGNGLDGGQTGGNPFAIDELEQISVAIAPFDVRQSGFAGGAINATTKAGTNEFHGSAYWFARNETLAGKTAVYEGNDSESLDEFSAERYGFSLGGAIIKDKLFFFTTWEREELGTPLPFLNSSYIGNSQGTDELAQLTTALFDRYGYNPGGFGSTNDQLKTDKFVTRLDWNINQNHSVSFKYKFTEFNQFSGAQSNTSTINFSDRSIVFPSKKNTFALDWNARWSDRLTSKFLANYKTVRDDRDPNGSFPTISLEDGSGSIQLGAEQFSTANRLDQDVLGFIGNIEYDLGNHNLLFGAEYNNYKVLNIFIRRNFGAYEWNDDSVSGLTGLQRFLAGEDPDRFRRNFSIVDGDTVGDSNEGAAADFTASQFGLYLQDEWKVKRNLTLTAGVRIDIPSYDETTENADFNNTLSDYVAAGYDLHGARTGQAINSEVHFSPRFGFEYKPNLFGNDLKTKIYGGIGVFTSRIPLVWVGGSYNNNGLTQGEVDIRQDPTTPGSDLTFNPDISSNNGGTVATSTPQIDLFAEDFKLPQRLKASIGIDQKLPYGVNFNVYYQYDNTINDVFYQNVNITQQGNFVGADNRPRWAPTFDSPVNSNYGDVLVASNTSEGYAHTFTVGADKTFFRDLFVSLNYTYNDSYAVNDGTSSQNSSQWNNLPTVDGKNRGVEARSDYSLGSRVTGLLAYTFNWNNARHDISTARTTISAFYEGIDGAPYSYVYNEGSNSSSRLLYDDRSNRDASLIYVPNDISEINLQDGFRGQTVQEQWDLLNAFIEGDSYLRSRRGQYVEKNGSRLPWSNVVDLRVLQEFDLKIGEKKHTLGFSVDIFNFTNLLNRDWGRRYTNDHFRGYQLINLVDVTETTAPGATERVFTPTFGIDANALDRERIEAFDNDGVQSSIWQIQFGVKYSF